MENKNTLIVNCGSTSIKYKFFNQKGEVIFLESFSSKDEKDKKKEAVFLKNIKKITKKGSIKIAFRVVHGGDIEGPVILDNSVIKKIKEFVVFAPIHNKIVLKKIKSLKKIFDKVFEEDNFFAVFDTDFHRSIPKEFSTYPIDQDVAKKFGIKKYGFHGIAVESALSKIKDADDKKIIFAHLGGGSSLTAVFCKKSIANTMGLTPTSGLMMATRVGDADSDLDIILSQKMQKNMPFVSDMLSRRSGFLGLTGNSDLKDIFSKAQDVYEKQKSFEKEKLAFDLYLNNICEKIGGYFAILGGCDLLVFSGGIGEGNSFFRKKLLEKVAHMGITKEKVVVVDVDEEQVIFDKINYLK